MHKKIKSLAFTTIIILSALQLTGCGMKTNLPDLSSMGEIEIISREEGSGTKAEFEGLIGTIASGTTKVISSTEDVIEEVKNNENAIGYAAYGLINEKSGVKVLSVDGVKPSADSIKDNKYKLDREYILAYEESLSDVEKDFLKYVLSDGQKIVKGYATPVKKEATFLSDKSKGKITINGSTSMEAMVQSLADVYVKYNPNAEIKVSISDSTTGITDAIQGKCSFAMSSRELKDYENELLTKTVIAKDAIAIIVNEKNPIDDISVKYIKNIYDKKYKAWSDMN